ncbi:MAG: hypothetical protein U9Q68_04195, partial [Euryarchaeota archaeon]|nr:hypothetical protein [Euryarchaeota archaeon]
DIIDGVGTLDITDTVAETVNLSLFDSESTGLDVSSTQDVVFGQSAAATKVRVETKVDGTGTVVEARNVASGSAITVYAITRDANDNFVVNVAADAWSLTSKTGGVADGDLVAAGDNKSAVFTGALAGTAVINVTSGTLTAGESGIITVTAGTLDHINVTPTSASLNVSSDALTEVFTATGHDSCNNQKSGLNFTWASSDAYAGTIAWTTLTNGTFTAERVGMSYITARNGSKTSNDVQVTVNAGTNYTNVTGMSSFTATSGDATVTGSNFSSNLTGWINTTAIGNATNASEVNQSKPRCGLGLGDKVVNGVTIDASGNIREELEAGNGTIRIRICYNITALKALGIDASTLAIWKYDNVSEKWEKQPSTITPEGCVYADMKHLCGVGLISSKPDVDTSNGGGGGGGGSGTYPPGWGVTPTATATKTPAASATATDTPGERVTPGPEESRPTASKTTTPEAKGTATTTPKKSTPGFTAICVIAGLLAVAYAMMRRRE